MIDLDLQAASEPESVNSLNKFKQKLLVSLLPAASEPESVNFVNASNVKAAVWGLPAASEPKTACFQAAQQWQKGANDNFLNQCNPRLAGQGGIRQFSCQI